MVAQVRELPEDPLHCDHLTTFLNRRGKSARQTQPDGSIRCAKCGTVWPAKPPLTYADGLRRGAEIAKAAGGNGALIELAKKWWAAHPMKSEIVRVAIKGDGYIRFDWQDHEESGPYHLSIGELLKWAIEAEIKETT